ncbi:hypothetical protein TNCV_1737121 [Trichonephila clavipes]|nr:hypothetical protein TNCV_1737121 [Trichonephila clavipes]
MRAYDFHTQKMGRFQPGANPQPYTKEANTLPLRHRGGLISLKLKRSSTLQLDSEIRKELNLDHSSLEFLQEPLIPKNPPKNTCFELELLQRCSKKEEPVTLRQKGLLNDSNTLSR